MALKWTVSAERDLVRIHAFLAPVNSLAAVKVIKQLMGGAEQLLTYPQLGVSLEEFAPRDVRRVIVGDYELRYEVTENLIYILRLWHAREDR
ncbi:type II toxin-antitoxin system RelE/ParE family toxin [Nitrosospira sp. Nsp13]|uniref:type II toxin-antitoxin system RelE/ParE family toxin n=1 Tax=Nitrosospira sp. Nsp13 TaxID=1855332 RepID=UPI00088C93CE|nr:type II toxin-antitoxin system RelE/ParE family toxin [Nitrosospira sp. Nsp13]SCY38335.1 Plasmid stabilization system protein ParE [Nitrosospira sp. Nsp13]